MSRPSSPARPSLIVVGGHSRGVGKTSLIEYILARRRDEAWTAVKISAHRHAPPGADPPLVEEADAASPHTQTGRYLAAGASRAYLCRTPEARLRDTARFLEGLLAGGTSVIVESNRIAGLVAPDLALFVVDPSIADWKGSSPLVLGRADALVTPGDAAGAREAAFAHGWPGGARPILEMDRLRRVPALDAWLDERLPAACYEW